MLNVIELLTRDHREVEKLFARFNESGEGAVASTICRALQAHAEAEEHIVYPVLASAGQADAGVLFTEQSQLKALVTRALQSEGSPLTDLMAAIEAQLSDHVTEEEDVFFPALADALDVDALEALGARYLQVKLRSA